MGVWKFIGLLVYSRLPPLLLLLLKELHLRCRMPSRRRNPRKLTLHGIVILNNSPRVKSEHNTLPNAQVAYQNAFTESFLPSFSVSATADKNYSRPDNIHSWNEFRHFDSNAQASGTWNLLNSGKDRLAYQNASLAYEIAQISFDAFIQETVLSAVQTYYNLLLNQKLVEVYQADLEINRK